MTDVRTAEPTLDGIEAATDSEPDEASFVRCPGRARCDLPALSGGECAVTRWGGESLHHAGEG